MKSIQYAIWILIAMNIAYSIVHYATMGRTLTDSPGQKMASGFITALLIYTLIAGLISLIHRKWAKVTAFILLLLPLGFFLIGSFKL